MVWAERSSSYEYNAAGYSVLSRYTRFRIAVAASSILAVISTFRGETSFRSNIAAPHDDIDLITLDE